MAGIFISCRKGMESSAVRESYDLLGEYVNKLWPPRVDSDDDDEDVDIETSIQRETQRLQERPRLLNSIRIDVDCLLFLETWRPVDPVQLVHTILTDLDAKKEKRTRYVQRLVPITRTCYADMESIEKLAKEVLVPYFHPDGDENPKSISYSVMPKIRYCKVIDRKELIRMLAKLVGEPHTVNLKDPEVVIIAEVFKNVCGLSIVQDYNKLRRYNLETVSEEEQAEQAEQADQADQVDNQKEKPTSPPIRDQMPNQEGPSTSSPGRDVEAPIGTDTKTVNDEQADAAGKDNGTMGNEGERAETVLGEMPGSNQNGTTKTEFLDVKGEADNVLKTS